MSSQTSPIKSCETYPFPTCWQDNDRVQVLLAPFRNRSVNPENYDSKMKFWQDTIKEYCLVKGKANFCKQELQRNFTKGQRVPCCLDTVLEEMHRKKLIRLRKEYEYDPENSWYGWAVNSIFKPLYWSFDTIKMKLGSTNTVDLELVQSIHLEVIKEYCTLLQELMFQPPYLSSLYHYDVLRKEICTSLNITEECLRICLRTLHVQKKIGLEYESNTQELQIHLVKIPAKGDCNINITETDHAIHNLQNTKRDLQQQIEDIDLEVRDNENKARQYIKENKRVIAKTFLRKKHLLEKNQERRMLALHNVETLLSNVDEAKLNGVILDTYKFGSKALQNALDTSNLKYDNVDEIVSDVQESMDSFREIRDSLANVTFNESSASLADEDELERELQEIMGESSKTTPSKNSTENNKLNVKSPIKVEFTDAELLDMLNGLEIQKNPSNKVVSQNVLS